MILKGYDIMKKIQKIVVPLIIGFICFASGTLFGYWQTNRQFTKVSTAMREMAHYIYNEIDTKFGSIDSSQEEYKNIVDGISFYKDMGFAIILEDGVKTIRVYK
jgi:hypothetical protein